MIRNICTNNFVFEILYNILSVNLLKNRNNKDMIMICFNTSFFVKKMCEKEIVVVISHAEK
jgi:hypothetical protein